MSLFWHWLRRRRATTAISLPRDLGLWGEDRAADHLRRGGWKILGRRVRPNRHDELDLVASRNGVLAFVEVKTRTDERIARPAAAVNTAKRHALNRAARAYLRQARYPDMLYRFDIIEVIGRPDTPQPQIRHLENAFPFERRLWH